MALAIADRVKELSNTTGTGPFHLTGATVGYKSAASALNDGDQSYFGAFDGAGTWVIFLGTYNAAANTVTVNTVLSSSPGYAGFATAPTVWIDSPATLLAKILPVMPTNDNVVGVNLTQTLSNKSFVSPVVVEHDFNGADGLTVKNTNNGNAAVAFVSVTNDLNHLGQFWIYGSGVTGTAGALFGPDTLMVSAGTANGMSIVVQQDNAAIRFGLGAVCVEKMRLTPGGALAIGQTTAIAGFLLDVRNDLNGSSGIHIQNQSTGASGAAVLQLNNSSGNNFSMWMQGTGAVQAGFYNRPDGAYLMSAGAGGLNLGTIGAQNLNFGVNGTGLITLTTNQVFEFWNGSGNLGHPNNSIIAMRRDLNDVTRCYIANGNTTGAAAQVGFVVAQNNTSAIFGILCPGYGGVAPYLADTTYLGAGRDLLVIVQTAGYHLYFGTGNARVARFASDSCLQIDPSTFSWTGVAKLWVSNAPSGGLTARFDTANGACECLGSSTAFMWHFFWGNPNGTVGGISTTGSTTTYATSSDYRLKDIAGPVDTTEALVNVNAIKIYNAKFKTEGDDTYRAHVLAHEVQEVFPHVVTGKKDAMRRPRLGPIIDGVADLPDHDVPDHQMIDFGQLGAPHLIAAIQELTKRLEALEGRTLH